uniref:Dynein light chain roadblock-type 1 n=1 Tax=Canis lupus dingo TaxID=286419 RepID=A0A8C0JUD6_CANLU
MHFLTTSATHTGQHKRLPMRIPIKSTMDNPTTTQYANLMHNFILKARSTVREIDPQNDLTFLRIRSKKNEIMVAPDKDYFLIVIQNPTE